MKKTLLPVKCRKSVKNTISYNMRSFNLKIHQILFLAGGLRFGFLLGELTTFPQTASSAGAGYSFSIPLSPRLRHINLVVVWCLACTLHPPPLLSNCCVWQCQSEILTTTSKLDDNMAPPSPINHRVRRTIIILINTL